VQARQDLLFRGLSPQRVCSSIQAEATQTTPSRPQVSCSKWTCWNLRFPTRNQLYHQEGLQTPKHPDLLPGGVWENLRRSAETNPEANATTAATSPVSPAQEVRPVLCLHTPLVLRLGQGLYRIRLGRVQVKRKQLQNEGSM